MRIFRLFVLIAGLELATAAPGKSLSGTAKPPAKPPRRCSSTTTTYTTAAQGFTSSIAATPPEVTPSVVATTTQGGTVHYVVEETQACSEGWSVSPIAGKVVVLVLALLNGIGVLLL